MHYILADWCHTSLGSDGSVNLDPPAPWHRHTAGPDGSRKSPAAWTHVFGLTGKFIGLNQPHFIATSSLDSLSIRLCSFFATFDHIGADTKTNWSFYLAPWRFILFVSHHIVAPGQCRCQVMVEKLNAAAVLKLILSLWLCFPTMATFCFILF